MKTATPGPWTVQREENDFYIVATPHGDGVTTPAGEYTLAYVPIGLGIRGSEDEAEANARLFAGASELAELVARMAAYCPVEVQNDARTLLARIDGDGPSFLDRFRPVRASDETVTDAPKP